MDEFVKNILVPIEESVLHGLKVMSLPDTPENRLYILKEARNASPEIYQESELLLRIMNVIFDYLIEQLEMEIIVMSH